MKPRPLSLISDEDTVLQERKGNWAKLPQRQEGSNSSTRRLSSPLPGCAASA